MRNTTRKLPSLYLDVNDVMAQLDVTRRQLRHWEENGLLTPEIGRNRYTARDIERLKLIRRLVVEENFPVEVLRRLFAKQLWTNEFDDDVHDRARSGDLTNQVLDIDSGALLSREDTFQQLWNEFVESADSRELETRLLQLGLVLFRELRDQSRTPLGFRGRVEEIETRIHELSQVARLAPTYDDDVEGDPGPPTGLQLRPLLDDESDDTDAELESLLRRNKDVITELEEASSDISRRGRMRLHPASHRRLSPLTEVTDIVYDR